MTIRDASQHDGSPCNGFSDNENKYLTSWAGFRKQLVVMLYDCPLACSWTTHTRCTKTHTVSQTKSDNTAKLLTQNEQDPCFAEL